MTAMRDLTAREKAAQLAEAHSKAFQRVDNCGTSISQQEYDALDKAEKDAFEAFYSHPVHSMETKDERVFRCPNPNCRWPIVKEDLE